MLEFNHFLDKNSHLIFNCLFLQNGVMPCHTSHNHENILYHLILSIKIIYIKLFFIFAVKLRTKQKEANQNRQNYFRMESDHSLDHIIYNLCIFDQTINVFKYT